MENISVDGTDPVVVVLTWLLTMILGKMIERFGLDEYRAALPAAAVVLATGIRIAIEAAMGDPLSIATVLRALAAGAVAVASHSQFREVFKLLPSPVKVDAAPEHDAKHSER